ncbi:hypothetical protein QCA50_006392 [Cerrena zonata]|uniref:F-box domain-containing protein n=1 Tax=Cerrena zonata TaxID=2478898 RepID=A0AAW0G7Z3_9APHY
MLSNLTSTLRSLWLGLPSILYNEPSKIPPLPVELIMQIIEYVHEDKDVLKACTLVSKTWFPTAHSLLFGHPTVILFDTPELDLLSILQNLHRTTRDLTYIRALTIEYRLSALCDDPTPTVLTFRTLMTLTALLPNLTELEMVNLTLHHESFLPLRLVEGSDEENCSRDWVKTIRLDSVTYEPPKWDPQPYIFDYLFTIFPGVEHLFCHGDTERQHLGPAPIDPNAVVLHRTPCPPLKTLSHYSLRKEGHSAGFVEGIRPFLQSLETLDLTDDQGVGFIPVFEELKGYLWPSLKTLRFGKDGRTIMRNCISVPNRVAMYWEALGLKYFPKLDTVSIVLKRKDMDRHIYLLQSLPPTVRTIIFELAWGQLENSTFIFKLTRWHRRHIAESVERGVEKVVFMPHYLGQKMVPAVKKAIRTRYLPELRERGILHVADFCERLEGCRYTKPPLEL